MIACSPVDHRNKPLAMVAFFVRSPGVLSMASSIKGESSYSYLTDMDIGLSLIDRFTYASLDFFEGVDIHSNMTMDQLMRIYRQVLHSCRVP